MSKETTKETTEEMLKTKVGTMLVTELPAYYNIEEEKKIYTNYLKSLLQKEEISKITSSEDEIISIIKSIKKTTLVDGRNATLLDTKVFQEAVKREKRVTPIMKPVTVVTEAELEYNNKTLDFSKTWTAQGFELDGNLYYMMGNNKVMMAQVVAGLEKVKA